MAKRDIGSLNVKLTASADEFKTDMKRASAAVDEFKKNIAKDKGTKGWFKSVAAQWGEQSALGQTAKMLAGGGAIMAGTMLVRELSESTKRITEFVEKLAEGKANARDMVFEIGKAIPVLGTIVDFGESIGALLMADVNARIRMRARSIDEQRRSIQESRDAEKRAKERIEGLITAGENRRRLAGAVGFDKERIQVEIDTEKLLKDIADLQKTLPAGASDIRLTEEEIRVHEEHNAKLADINKREVEERKQLVDKLVGDILETQSRIAEEVAKAQEDMIKEAGEKMADATADMVRKFEKRREPQAWWGPQQQLQQQIAEIQRQVDEGTMTLDDAKLNAMRAGADFAAAMRGQEIGAEVRRGAFRVPKSVEDDRFAKALKEAQNQTGQQRKTNDLLDDILKKTAIVVRI